jgi:UDP-3-O-[3-hydroxymyristoyl] glucosamine N-acyltransferase
MRISLKSILHHLSSKEIEFSVHGDDISVTQLAAIGSDVQAAVCYYVGDDPEALTGVERSIVVCKPGLDVSPARGNTYIFTDSPQLCFYHVSSLFEDRPQQQHIHNQSVVDRSAVIGQNPSIGPFCTIDQCTIGNNVVIESGVTIRRGTVIGNDVWIQANSVIGATGAMWVWDQRRNRVRCTQTGNVVIEDDVFLGSNITIVRGAFANRPTVIGAHTVIAHGTMIGHGSMIGAYNHLANNVAIAGSVQTGRYCLLGSGCAIRPHVKLPEETIVGTGAVVVKDFSERGLILAGNPAERMAPGKDRPSGVPAPFRP